MFKPYKKEQGRMVRMAAYWSVALLLLFGCTSLHTTLISATSIGEFMSNTMFVVPIVGVNFNPGFITAAIVFIAGMLGLAYWQEKPKVADLLIDTEGELKKVTWPQSQEVIDSSIVVVVCVVFLMGYLAGADWLLARLAQWVLVQS